MLRKLNYFIILLIFTSIYGNLNGQNAGFDIKTLVIDAGHGGKDPGANYDNAREKDIVLNVALYTGSIIKKQFPDVKVIYTRDKDVFIPLDQRANIANKNNADLFISIHINACPEPNTNGTETYILGQHRSEENLKVAQMENSVILMEDDYTTRYEGFDPNSPESYIMFELIQNEFLEQSRILANYVETNFTGYAKRKSRGVRQAGFLVLRKTTMPSILIELGFISNKTEQNFLLTKEGQETMAQCIANSFTAFKSKFDAKNNTVNKPVTKANKPHSIELKATPNNNSSKDITINKKIVPIEEINKDSSFYAIQIAASPFQLEPNFAIFKNINTVYSYSENNLYKYYCGICNDYSLFNDSLKTIKLTIKDAFPVIFRNGKKEKFQKL